MKKFTFALSLFSFLTVFGFSQSAPIIINEIGVKPNSSQKYIELLVTGEDGANLDLSGWLLDVESIRLNDDNVYLQFGSCFTSVPVGTIILIYNDYAPHSDINVNNDGYQEEIELLQIPLSSPCLVKRKGSYVNGDTITTITPAALSAMFSLDRVSDAVQLRDQNNEMRFALNWSGEEFDAYEQYQVVNITLGQYPVLNSIALGGVLCDEDYSAGFEGQINGSPGRVNSPDNEQYVNDIRNGVMGTPLDIDCTELASASNESETGEILVTIYSGIPPFTISWQNNNGEQGSLEVMESGDHVIESLTPGYYEISVTDGRGCVKSCNSFTSYCEEIVICEGSCVTIGEDIEDGLCYYWMPSSYFENEIDQLQKKQEVCPVGPMEYEVLLTDNKGNIVGKKRVKISIGLEVNPDGGILCSTGEAIQLMATEGYSYYEWSTGEITQSISINSSGEYAVTATGQNGCISSESVTVYDQENIDIESFLIDNGFTCLSVTFEDPGIMNNNPVERFTWNCPSAVEVEDYTDGLQVIFDGESVCLTEIFYEDIQNLNDYGYDVAVVIADQFCGEGSINTQDFMSFGQDLHGAIQIFAVDNEGGDDCLYFRHTGFYSSLDQILNNITYSPDCEAETTPSVGCNYTVAQNDGQQQGYFFSSESWEMVDLVEIELNPLTTAVPSNDRDNTWADESSLPPISEYSNWTRFFLNQSTESNWKEFELAVTKPSRYNVGCGSVCGDAAEVLAANFYKGDITNIEWGPEDDFASYLYTLKETQKTIKDIQTLIINWYRANATLDGLFTSDNNFTDIHRPRYDLFNLGAFTTIGGTQSLEIKVLRFEHECYTSKIDCVVEITVGDYFGAGISDGVKFFPGLNNQFILQHFRNDDCFIDGSSLCYTPLIHKIKFCHAFQFSLF